MEHIFHAPDPPSEHTLADDQPEHRTFAGNSYLPRYSLKLNRTLELLLASIPLAP